MSAFKPEALIEKIGKLNATQQSIETVSQWCIFFRKDAKQIVSVWESEFAQTKDLGRRLALVYLANDILQNSRKKGPQFVNEFYHKLPPAVHQLLKYGDKQIRDSMGRMIKVWEERRVFGSSGLKPFTDLMPDQPRQDQAAPSGRKGHILLQGSEATVERLAAAMAGAAEIHARCEALAEQSSAVLSQDGGADVADPKMAAKGLQRYIAALQNELGHRDTVLSFLQQLSVPHDRARSEAEERLSACQLRLQQLQEQARASAGAQQSPAPAAGSATPPAPPETTAQPDATVPGPPDAGPPAGEPALALPSGFTAADLVAQLSQSGSTQMLLDALASLPKENGPPVSAGQGEEDYDPELGM